jgi:hypothetical protein
MVNSFVPMIGTHQADYKFVYSVQTCDWWTSGGEIIESMAIQQF